MDDAEPHGFTTLELARADYQRIITHCLSGLPNEACGLLTGPWNADGPSGIVGGILPCENADASAMTFSIAPRDLLRATRTAEATGDDLIGVWHSHTHTDAYPSPTDVRQAADPSWAYVIVSLAFGHPVLRAYRIVDRAITEIEVRLVGGAPARLP